MAANEYDLELEFLFELLIIQETYIKRSTLFHRIYTTSRSFTIGGCVSCPYLNKVSKISY